MTTPRSTIARPDRAGPLRRILMMVIAITVALGAHVYMGAPAAGAGEPPEMEWVPATEAPAGDGLIFAAWPAPDGADLAAYRVIISPCGDGASTGWSATEAAPGPGEHSVMEVVGENIIFRATGIKVPRDGAEVGVRHGGKLIYRSGCIDESGGDIEARFPADDHQARIAAGEGVHYAPMPGVDAVPDPVEPEVDPVDEPWAGLFPEDGDEDGDEWLDDDEWAEWAEREGIITPPSGSPDPPTKSSPPPVRPTWYWSMAGLGIIAGLSRLRDRDLADGYRSGGWHPYYAIGVAVLAIASGIGSLASIRSADHPAAISAALATATLLGWVLASRRTAYGGRILSVEILRLGWETNRRRVLGWTATCAALVGIGMSDTLGWVIGAGIGAVLGAADAGVSARRMDEALIGSLTESIAGILGTTARVLDDTGSVSVTAAGTVRVRRLPGGVQARIAADPEKIRQTAAALLSDWVIIDLQPTHLEMRQIGAQDVDEMAERMTREATGGMVTGLAPTSAERGTDVDTDVFDFASEED